MEFVFNLLFCASILIPGYSLRFSNLRGDNVRNDSVRFIVIGDWGGLPDFPYRTPVEKAVGREMGKIADYLDTQFVLALGDNFYFDGVKDVADPRFKETFEDVYTSKSLMRNWYLVAGNHDHNGNVTAQIEYTKRTQRWNFPNFYYKIQFKIPGSASTIDIIMIDTVLLCGNSDDDRLGKQPKGPESLDDAEKQWTWIESNLKASKADYLIVAGHFPVLSIAEHGPTKCLTDRLMPMLYKYRATAYFCGHDHNIQHLQYNMPPYNRTVDYYLSGAANFIDPSEAHRESVPEGSLKYYWANFLSLGAFGYVEANNQIMNFTFIEANGKHLYQNHMYPRKL